MPPSTTALDLFRRKLPAPRHGPRARCCEPAVVLTLKDANPNGASIRFLVEGADLPSDASGYARICVLFDGTDQDALLRAREQWKQAKEAGHAIAYWQQDESGRWNKKA